MIKIILINLLIITSSLATDDAIEVEIKRFLTQHNLLQAEEEFSKIENQAFHSLFYPLLCKERELQFIQPANDQKKLINVFVNTEHFASILGKREKEIIQAGLENISYNNSLMQEINKSASHNFSGDREISLKESIQNEYGKFEELFLEKKEDALLEDEILRIGVTSVGGRHVISTLYILFYARECFSSTTILDSEVFYQTFKEVFHEKGINLEQENAPLQSRKIQNYLVANLPKKFLKYNNFFSNSRPLSINFKEAIKIEKEYLNYSPSKNNSSFTDGSFLAQYSGFLAQNPSQKAGTSLKKIKNKKPIDPTTASFN